MSSQVMLTAAACAVATMETATSHAALSPANTLVNLRTSTPFGHSPAFEVGALRTQSKVPRQTSMEGTKTRHRTLPSHRLGHSDNRIARRDAVIRRCPNAASLSAPHAGSGGPDHASRSVLTRAGRSAARTNNRTRSFSCNPRTGAVYYVMLQAIDLGRPSFPRPACSGVSRSARSPSTLASWLCALASGRSRPVVPQSSSL